MFAVSHEDPVYFVLNFLKQEVISIPGFLFAQSVMKNKLINLSRDTLKWTAQFPKLW